MTKKPLERSATEKNYEPAKQAYRKPELLQFGLLSVITQGTGSMNVDSVAGRRKN